MNTQQITETLIKLNHVEQDLQRLNTIATTLIESPQQLTVLVEIPIPEDATKPPPLPPNLMADDDDEQQGTIIKMDPRSFFEGLFSGAAALKAQKPSQPTVYDYANTVSYTDGIAILIAQKQKEKSQIMRQLSRVGIKLPKTSVNKNF